MKAAVLRAHREPLEIEHRPDPSPGPGDVVIRVEAEGICRSDWHTWMGDWDWVGNSPKLPICLGHEMAGVVEAAGSDVRDFRPGDRVLSTIIWCCMQCEYCLAGQRNRCAKARSPGLTDDGGYARYVKVPRADFNLFHLPENVDFVTGAAMGCRFPTAYHGLCDRARLKGGQWLAVHGCGGVGLSAVQIGAALGANVIAVDIAEEHLAAARELGAVSTVNAGDGHAADIIRDLTAGGAHVSVDALGRAETSVSSVRSLRKGGRHLQLGLTTREEAGEVRLPVDWMVMNEITFATGLAHNHPGYAAMLGMVANGRVDPRKLVSRTVALEEASDVIAQMTDYGTLGMVVIDRW